jgi:hypothetical protein
MRSANSPFHSWHLLVSHSSLMKIRNTHPHLDEHNKCKIVDKVRGVGWLSLVRSDTLLSKGLRLTRVNIRHVDDGLLHCSSAETNLI